MRGLLLALFLAVAAAAQENSEEKLEIRNLGTCGLVTRYASSQINDTCMQEALNIYLDEDAGISRRKGFAKYNTTALPGTKAVRGFWSFRANDGTEYMVALSSQTVFSSNGQGAFNAIPGLVDLSATQDMDCAQCLGKLWCVNGSDTMFSWDGSSTDTISTAPTCQAVDCFRNRVILGNCSGTLSQLRMSGELDGTDYTIPTIKVSTSPAALAIGGVNDGNKLVGIMGVYQDVLVLGKLDSTYGLYGFDRDDFTVREISREVGLVDNRSAREKQGSLYWLSKRGVEKMTGPSITRVSDPVRDLIDTVIVAGGNSRSITDTTQTDFQAGNLTASGAGAPMSATISPFNVVASSWGIVNTNNNLANETTDYLILWNTGASSGTMSSGQLFWKSGFEDSTSSGAIVKSSWTFGGSDGQFRYDGSLCGASNGGTFNYGGVVVAGPKRCASSKPSSITSMIQIVNANSGAVIAFSSYTYSASTYCTRRTMDLSGQSSLFKIIIGGPTTGDSSWSISVATSPTISSGSLPSGILEYGEGAAMPAASPQLQCSGGLSSYSAFFDFPDPYYVSASTYISSIFDTGMSTPVWGPFSASISSNSQNSLEFAVQSASSTNGIFENLTGQAVGIKISAQAKRFVRYKSFFNNSISSASATVTDISLLSQTTGYFISSCKNPGTSITSWGLFQCNSIPNGGEVTFQVSTGPTCHSVGVATAPWTAQTNNSIVNIATAPYVAYRALFSLDSATQTPRLNDCTINWNEGTSRPSVSAEVYRERYYLAYTSGTSGTVANDHIAVLDSRDQWVLHDAPNCSALGMYNRGLYCGDSGATGQIYQMDAGLDDNGVEFTSTIKTKDFDFGNTFQKKILKRMYFDLAGVPDQSYSITLAPSYTLDASTDTFSLPTIDLNEDYSRFIAAKVPASLDYNTTGRWFSFGLTNTGTCGPWKVFGIRAVYQRLTED